MEPIHSPVARRWLSYVLYYVEQHEKLTASLSDELLGASVAAGEKESRSAGELLQEAGMMISHSINATVEIVPKMEAAIQKDEIVSALRRGREALCNYVAGLSEEELKRRRTTVLNKEASSFIEQMVVLVSQLSRTLGQVLLIARLHGHRFDIGKLDKHPFPDGYDDSVPCLDRQSLLN